MFTYNKNDIFVQHLRCDNIQDCSNDENNCYALSPAGTFLDGLPTQVFLIYIIFTGKTSNKNFNLGIARMVTYPTVWYLVPSSF